jgi:hypothetical protein
MPVGIVWTWVSCGRECRWTWGLRKCPEKETSEMRANIQRLQLWVSSARRDTDQWRTSEKKEKHDGGANDKGDLE